MPVSTDDYVSVSDFVGRYCWLIDSGDGDGWSALWAEDGVFNGLVAEPIVGREALRAIPPSAFAVSKGTMRHHAGSLVCDYDDNDSNIVIVKYYNMVTNWSSGGKLFCLADITIHLIRNGNSWLIQKSEAVTLV